jgi:WD40 repeat protein
MAHPIQRQDSTVSDQPDLLRKKKMKYTAERLMMMLDKEKLEALEEEFNEHPDGIELPNFVWLMKCAMSTTTEEKAELVLGLYHLFQEIDINGDEHMEWSEFTQYIIDAVMGQNNKEKKEDRELTPAEIMELAQSHKSRRYQQSNLVDRSLHVGFIRHCHYAPCADLIMVVEMGAKQLRFYNTDCQVELALAPVFREPAFVLSAAYSEADQLIAIACSDKQAYLYQDAAYNFRFLGSRDLKVLNHSLWYFPEHGVWVGSTEKHVLKHWDIKSGLEIFSFEGHTDTIMDAVELRLPQAIATASMDGSIILWDFTEQTKLAALTGKHPKGVRSIDYCPDYGGNIVSVGYDKHIHVWSPEVSLSQCYTGKLEGHNCPVVACKFFEGRPVCVSVDEKGNIRIWDVRFFSCLQILTHDRGKVEVCRLVTLTKHDKFIIAGRRLLWFELLKESALKTTYTDVTPVYAEFNHYYLQFVVATKYDVRIFDSFTGRLKKIYTEVQDTKTESELSAFTFDSRHRKFFVGDNTGGIRTYNYSNGALLKDITSTPAAEEGKVEELKAEISGLHFCNEDKLLIVSSWDSTIQVYDQADPEQAPRLRLMTGGHQESDITCLTYSSHLSLLASGSTNGIVSIWDFELAKLEAACLGHIREVSSLVFTDPYPILCSMALDSVACFWAVRPYAGKSRYHCILRVQNRSWTTGRDRRTSITCSAYFNGDSTEVRREPRRSYVKVKKLVEVKKAPGSSEAQRQALRSEKSQLRAAERLSAGIRLPETQPEEGVSENSDPEPLESDMEWVEEFVYETRGEAAQDNKRCYMYIGDAKGYIKIWDIVVVAQEFDIDLLETSEHDKPSYNPRRKDEKNAENDVRFWLKEGSRELLPPLRKPEETLLVKEWQAHSAGVNSIRIIENPKGIVSCSADRTLKTWSLHGELWGVIVLNGTELPRAWKFPFDWEAKRLADINKVVEVLTVIDEKIDFDPNALSLPTFQDEVVTTQQQSKAVKLSSRKPKVLQEKRPTTAQKVQEMFAKHMHADDEDDSDDEGRQLQATSELSTNTLKLQERLEGLRRKLQDAEDTNRSRNFKGKKQGRPKLTKVKGKEQSQEIDETARRTLDISKPESRSDKSRNSSYFNGAKPRLPVVPSNPIREESAGEDPSSYRKSGTLRSSSTLSMLKKPPAVLAKSSNIDKALSLVKSSSIRRPVLGYAAASVPINRLYLERLGNEINHIKLTNIQ